MTWRLSQELQKTQGNYSFEKHSDDLQGKKKEAEHN